MALGKQRKQPRLLGERVHRNISTWIRLNEHEIKPESMVLFESNLSYVLLFDCSRGFFNKSRLVQ